MSKLAVLIAAAATGGGLFLAVTLGGEGRWSHSYAERVKGHEGYYEREGFRAEVAGLPVRIRSESGEWQVLVEVSYVYRPSKVLEDHRSWIARRQPWLRDGLILFLSEKRMEDFEGPRRLYRLKQELRRLLERKLFPDQEGRVERVDYQTLLLQSV